MEHEIVLRDGLVWRAQFPERCPRCGSDVLAPSFFGQRGRTWDCLVCGRDFTCDGDG